MFLIRRGSRICSDGGPALVIGLYDTYLIGSLTSPEFQTFMARNSQPYEAAELSGIVALAQEARSG